MDFQTILMNLLTKGVKSFNTGNYEYLDELISENVQFTSPTYFNDLIDLPAVEIHSKKELFDYWRDAHERFPFQITKVEYLEINKVSKFQCEMSGIQYIVDVEIHFDEYGKATKILNVLADRQF
jgi:hypothetical protein